MAGDEVADGKMTVLFEADLEGLLRSKVEAGWLVFHCAMDPGAFLALATRVEDEVFSGPGASRFEVVFSPWFEAFMVKLKGIGERERLIRIFRGCDPAFQLPPDDGRGWIITLRGVPPE